MTALQRLAGDYYNSRPVSAGNPGGLAAGGHQTNFPAALADLAAELTNFAEDFGAILQAYPGGQAAFQALSNAAVTAAAEAKAARDATIEALNIPTRIRDIPALITDWNTALENGWFQSNPGNTNAPNATRTWVGRVEVRRDKGAVRQVLWDAAVTLGETYVRDRTGANVWSAWSRVRETEAEQDARNDARYAGDAGLPLRLGTIAQTITDWNAAPAVNGWFMGQNAANAPLPNLWFIGEQVVHAGPYRTQTVWAFQALQNDNLEKYTRQGSESSPGVAAWTPWRKMRVTQAEQEALFLRRDGAFAMTAPIVLQGVPRERVVAQSSFAFDLSAGSQFLFGPTGAGTVSLANASTDANYAQAASILTFNGGSHAINWGVNFWAGGQAPTLGVNAWDLITLIRVNQSSSWTLFGIHTPMRVQ